MAPRDYLESPKGSVAVQCSGNRELKPEDPPSPARRVLRIDPNLQREKHPALLNFLRSKQTEAVPEAASEEERVKVAEAAAGISVLHEGFMDAWRLSCRGLGFRALGNYSKRDMSWGHVIGPGSFGLDTG